MAVEPKEGVESPPGRRVGPIAVSQVPFAHGMGGVAQGCQGLWQQRVLDAHLGVDKSERKLDPSTALILTL